MSIWRFILDAVRAEYRARSGPCPAHPYPDRAIVRPEWLDRCTCSRDAEQESA